jgi:hypothetical protein
MSMISRACEALGCLGRPKSLAYVSDRSSFFGNRPCLANFRESAKHALTATPVGLNISGNIQKSGEIWAQKSRKNSKKFEKITTTSYPKGLSLDKNLKKI